MKFPQPHRTGFWLMVLTCLSHGCSEDTDCAHTATCAPATTVSHNSGQPAKDAGSVPSAEVAPQLPTELDASMSTATPEADDPLNPVFVLSVCGNAQTEPGEACDDGNDVDGDGCSACEFEPGELCLSGSKQCTAGGLEETCSAEGAWASAVGCTNQACPPGGAGCQGVCTPGAKRCTAAGLEETCTADGAWAEGVLCSGGACPPESAGCEGVCLPKTTRCAGNGLGVETCSATGVWEPAVSCNGQACPAGGTTCVGNCAPGTKQCSSNGVQTCDASGNWGAAVACVDQACPLTNGGTCTCTPGETAACASTASGEVIHYPKLEAGQPLGTCKMGSRQCLAGGVWGTCTGAAAPQPESCDGNDSDCDGIASADEKDAVGQSTFVCDADLDGYAPQAGAIEVIACQVPATGCAGGKWLIDPSSAVRADCDDTDQSRHPGAVDHCDGIDQDCDGSVTTGCGCTVGDARPVRL